MSNHEQAYMPIDIGRVLDRCIHELTWLRRYLEFTPAGMKFAQSIGLTKIVKYDSAFSDTIEVWIHIWRSDKGWEIALAPYCLYKLWDIDIVKSLLQPRYGNLAQEIRIRDNTLCYTVVS